MNNIEYWGPQPQHEACHPQIAAHRTQRCMHELLEVGVSMLLFSSVILPCPKPRGQPLVIDQAISRPQEQAHALDPHWSSRIANAKCLLSNHSNTS